MPGVAPRNPVGSARKACLLAAPMVRQLAMVMAVTRGLMPTATAARMTSDHPVERTHQILVPSAPARLAKLAQRVLPGSSRAPPRPGAVVMTYYSPIRPPPPEGPAGAQ